MKIQSNTFLKKVSHSEIKDLTKEIHETLDIDIKHKHVKIFSGIDLWSIHKQKKNVYPRRLLF